MSMDEYLQQLGRAHGFTLDELRANQAGKLHPDQLARGLRSGSGAVATFSVLGIVALVGGLGGALVFLDELGGAPSRVDLNAVYAIAGSGVLLALAFFFGAHRSLARKRVRNAAFAELRIDVLEGPVHKTHVRGNVEHYRFRVGPRSFDTTEKVWELLTQGAPYRLHCVDDQLLSFAPVIEDAHERAEYEREVEQFERTRNIQPSGLVK